MKKLYKKKLAWILALACLLSLTGIDFSKESVLNVYANTAVENAGGTMDASTDQAKSEEESMTVETTDSAEDGKESAEVESGEAETVESTEVESNAAETTAESTETESSDVESTELALYGLEAGADGSSVTVGGLTFSADDGNALVVNVDYKVTTRTISVDNVYDNAYAGANVTENMIEIMTSRPLTVSGTSTTHGIRIGKGTHASLTFDGVSITGVVPFDIATNNPNSATRGSGISSADRTKLHLTLADGKTNTLTAKGTDWPGLHCGEGTELVIDDTVWNQTTDGTEVVPAQG